MNGQREPLYFMTVDTLHDRQRLVSITGTRETVLDVALRVILDSAPTWEQANRTTPMFQVSVWEASR